MKCLAVASTPPFARPREAEAKRATADGSSHTNGLDHGIRGVVININDRRKDLLHAEGTRLARGTAPADARARDHSSRDAMFMENSPYRQNASGSGLQTAEMSSGRRACRCMRLISGLTHKPARETNDAADVIFFDLSPQSTVSVAIRLRNVALTPTEISCPIFSSGVMRRFPHRPASASATPPRVGGAGLFPLGSTTLPPPGRRFLLRRGRGVARHVLPSRAHLNRRRLPRASAAKATIDDEAHDKNE